MSTKVRVVIDFLEEQAGQYEKKVDGLIHGDADEEVRGVAVAFIATERVVYHAKLLGANMLVTHEGIYHAHAGTAAQPENSSVARTKHEGILRNGMTVYRFHDGIHRYKPDGITVGLLKALQWEPYVEKLEPESAVLQIPPMRVEEAARHVKERLGISFLRFCGDSETVCRRVGVTAGYRGSGSQVIPLFERDGADLVLYGEGPEWEAPEYVRDAVYQGSQRALLVMGHAESESAGMRLTAELLREQFPRIPVHYIASEPVFTLL